MLFAPRSTASIAEMKKHTKSRKLVLATSTVHNLSSDALSAAGGVPQRSITVCPTNYVNC